MFRKILLVFAALLLAVLILAVSVAKTSAATGGKSKVVSMPTPTPEKIQVIKKPVDYFLAYPGILPDHFLYPIKMLRDKFMLFLTTDPVKKAELFLLYADKRLGAGKALIEGGKQELGVTTITKAEKYLEQAVNQEKAARKTKETKVLLEKLSKATQKHEEVLLEISGKLNGTAKTTVEQATEYARRGYQEVMKALSK